MADIGHLLAAISLAEMLAVQSTEPSLAVSHQRPETWWRQTAETARAFSQLAELMQEQSQLDTLLNSITSELANLEPTLAPKTTMSWVQEADGSWAQHEVEVCPSREELSEAISIEVARKSLEALKQSAVRERDIVAARFTALPYEYAQRSQLAQQQCAAPSPTQQGYGESRLSDILR